MKDTMISKGYVPDTGTPYAIAVKDIIHYRDQAKSTRLTDITFVFSLYSIIFATEIPYLNFVGFFVALVILIRGITIEVMAYDHPDTRQSPLDLEFRRFWNKGAVNGRYAPIGVPLVALLMAVDRRAYDIGIEVIRRIVSNE